MSRTRTQGRLLLVISLAALASCARLTEPRYAPDDEEDAALAAQAQHELEVQAQAKLAAGGPNEATGPGPATSASPAAGPSPATSTTPATGPSPATSATTATGPSPATSTTTATGPTVAIPSGPLVPASAAQDDYAAYKVSADLAKAAYDRRDFAVFLDHSRRAALAAPYLPKAIYNLACAYAVNRDAANAAATLDRLSSRKVYFDIAADADFDAVKDAPEIRGARERLEAVKTPIGRSVPAMSIPEKDLIPDGIAYDPTSGSFFVGSVYKRKIVRIAADGARSDFATDTQHGLYAVLGLAVDNARRILWACGSIVPEMSGYRPEDKGQAAIFQIDLSTGRLVKKVALSDPGREHNLNDLAIDSLGNLYISDAASSAVYTLPNGADTLQSFLEPGKLGSPNGIAFSPDERVMYIADYSRGIARVERDTRAISYLTPPTDAVLVGIDGLRTYRGDLIAIQNGIRPHRVVKLGLTGDGRAVRDAQVLEMNSPFFREPTLGTISGQDFYYIANSQWGSFTGGAIWPADRLTDVVILRMKLD